MAFTGKAVFSPNVFANDLAEDVAPEIGIVSTYEVPMLDALGDPQYPANSTYHQWPEDALAPNTFITSTAVGSVTTNTTIMIDKGQGSFLRPGAILRVPPEDVGRTDDGEYFQIVTVSGPDTLVVSRAFGGTTSSSFAAGKTIEVISDAALEGDDVTTDVSRPRPRKANIVQVIKKDVIVSGTMEAVKKVGGVTSELSYQEQQRLREALRDLEKVSIKGVMSGSPAGSSTVYRSMNGILRLIVTNVVSVAAVGGFTEQGLNDTVKKAWDNGARDMDLLVADALFKRQIDLLNASRVRVENTDGKVRNIGSDYESAFGTQRVLLSPWPAKNTVMVLSTRRLKVVPLVGRTFSSQPIAPTGDASKKMIIGEYTVELKNEEGMAVMRGR